MRKLFLFFFIIVAITLQAMSSQRRDRLLEFLSWGFYISWRGARIFRAITDGFIPLNLGLLDSCQ